MKAKYLLDLFSNIWGIMGSINCYVGRIKLNESKSMSQGYKTFFSFSIQLSMKFIILINVKMLKIAGILTFISMRHFLRDWKQEVFIFQLFSFYEQLKLHAQMS